MKFPNAFATQYLSNAEGERRVLISSEDKKRIQKAYLDLADKRRLIIALISYIGMWLPVLLEITGHNIYIQHKYILVKMVPRFWTPLKTVTVLFTPYADENGC